MATITSRVLDPKSLPHDDRYRIGAMFACLVSAGGHHGKRELEILTDLFERLGLDDADRGRLFALLGREQDARTYARQIADPSVRAMVLWDLLALAIADGRFDARDRQGLRRVADALEIPWARVQEAEAEVAKQLKARTAAPSGPKVRKGSDGRGWKVAAGIIGGGALLALTGGLAAPAIGGAIGTYFMGLSGAAAVNAGLAALGGGALAAGGFGMAGGTAVVTGLFGAAGAAIVGKKVATRTGAVEEFAFEHLGGQGLHVTVAVSGFLSQRDDFTDYWACLGDAVPHAERYAVRWEARHLLALGQALASFTSTQFTKTAAEVWARRASKSAARALQWPALALSAADVIDNPWHVAADRADKAALELAEVLRSGALGTRPVTLIGFSLGARQIFGALRDLARTGDHGRVHDAVLLGGAFTARRSDWHEVRPVVAGRLVNAYCTSDWVLAFLYRTAELQVDAAGLGPVAADGVESIDVTDLVGGHMGYAEALPRLARRIALDHGSAS
ncbi:MAG: DUF726 domain-containing protein [Myxococcota bacterium]